ncbi:putative eka-like protein [Erysiphe necator]|uniref:Putative eka-like protein n=1 Tax=Uncinula necator TaxID=52586 RepID=A0A0B1P2D8_UNCNE|nr:putative eka-like protein [Erysiphe necator]
MGYCGSKCKIRPRGTNLEKASAAPTDKRLFLRLPQEHEWRKLSSAGIREVIVKKLSISPTLVGKIKPVRSGFALSPCSTEAREKIFNAANGLFLTGVKLEAATNWVSVLIPTVPAVLHKEQGVVEVSNSMLADEVERVCSVRPAHIKLYGRNKPEAPHRTWMAFFPKAPRGTFKVNLSNFVKDAMGTTLLKIAQGLLRAEIVARLIIPRIYVWPQLSVEIVGARIALTVADVWPGQHAQVHLPKSN